MTTQYAGLDYGLGLSNVDKDNGIRYGVISMNSINLDCTDGFEYEYAGPNCPKCGESIKASDDESLFADYDGELDDDGTPEWFDGKDYCCLECKKCFWSDRCFSEESTGWKYESDGYQLTDCLDNDIFVLKSPYFTYAQFCSPCVPGAGNLDTPVEQEQGAKCYALGHDWFEDSKAPYRLWSVETGLEVLQ